MLLPVLPVHTIKLYAQPSGSPSYSSPHRVPLPPETVITPAPDAGVTRAMFVPEPLKFILLEIDVPLLKYNPCEPLQLLKVHPSKSVEVLLKGFAVADKSRVVIYSNVELAA